MLKATYGVSPAQTVNARISTTSPEKRATIKQYLAMIERSAKVTAVLADPWSNCLRSADNGGSWYTSGRKVQLRRVRPGATASNP